LFLLEFSSNFLFSLLQQGFFVNKLPNWCLTGLSIFEFDTEFW
jgi:hypothetical protein